MNLFSFTIWGDQPLYWKNIPFLLIAYDILFSGFRQIYYVHRSSVGIPVLGVLEECAKTGKVQLVIHDDRSEDKILMLHRMKPLWDSTPVSYLFPRDLDSIPTSWEARAVRVFIKSGLPIHMFRGNRCHDTLMGGLSGYLKPFIHRAIRIPKTFPEFVRTCVDGNGKHSQGTDQTALGNIMKNHMNFVLDAPVCGATKLEWLKAVQYPESAYKAVDLSSIPQEFLERIDRDAIYPGAVVHVSQQTMLSALSFKTDLAGAVDRALGSWKDAYLGSLPRP